MLVEADFTGSVHDGYEITLLKTGFQRKTDSCPAVVTRGVL